MHIETIEQDFQKIMHAMQDDMQGGEIFDVDAYGRWLEKSFVPAMHDILKDAEHAAHQKMNILSIKLLQETVNLAVRNQGSLSFTHRAIYDMCKRLGHTNKHDAQKLDFVAECSLTTAKLIPLAMQGCGVCNLIKTESFARQSQLTEQLWALEEDPNSVDFYPEERLYDVDHEGSLEGNPSSPMSQSNILSRGMMGLKKLFR